MKMRKLGSPGAAALALALLFASSVALAQGGPAVDWWVIGGAGGPASGGNVRINDTLGQPIIGPAQTGVVALGAGYWYGPGAAFSLAVDLASFAAEGQAGQVLVTWETVSELDNAGFNLYRTGSDTNPPEPEDLLAYVPSQAPGSTQGFAYSYTDTAVEPGQTVWYWLEDVDLSGAATLHGPVSATVGVPTAVELSRLEVFPVQASLPMAAVPALVAAAVAGALAWRRRR